MNYIHGKSIQHTSKARKRSDHDMKQLNWILRKALVLTERPTITAVNGLSFSVSRSLAALRGLCFVGGIVETVLDLPD